MPAFSEDPVRPTRSHVSEALRLFRDAVHLGLHSPNAESIPSLSLSELLDHRKTYDIADTCDKVIRSRDLTPRDAVVSPLLIRGVANLAGCAVIRDLPEVGIMVRYALMDIVDRYSVVSRDREPLFFVAMWRGYTTEVSDGLLQLNTDLHMSDETPALDYYEQALKYACELDTMPTTSGLAPITLSPLQSIVRLLRISGSRGEVYNAYCEQLDAVIGKCALEATPHVASGYLELGLYFSGRDEVERAIEVLEHGIVAARSAEAFSLLAMACHRLGCLHEQVGNLQGALSSFFEAGEAAKMAGRKGCLEVISREVALRIITITERMIERLARR